MALDEKLVVIEQCHKEDQQFHENLIDEIANEYDFGRAIAKVCVDKGLEDGHAMGYGEIRTQSEIAADFVEKILAIIGLA